jgi:type IV fimbrial biogenesis protein FimT
MNESLTTMAFGIDINMTVMNFQCNRGLTLIELIVVLAFVAVIMSMGVSSMVSVTLNSQATETMNDLISSLRTARSEAVTRFQDNVVICGSSDGSSCNSLNWSNGWLVFVDGDGDGDRDSDETILRIYDAPAERIGIFTRDLTNDHLVFDSEGMLVRESAFEVCDDRGPAHARAVVINASGQTRIAVDEDNDGTVDTHLGKVKCI